MNTKCIHCGRPIRALRNRAGTIPFVAVYKGTKTLVPVETLQGWADRFNEIDYHSDEGQEQYRVLCAEKDGVIENKPMGPDCVKATGATVLFKA